MASSREYTGAACPSRYARRLTLIFEDRYQFKLKPESVGPGHNGSTLMTFDVMEGGARIADIEIGIHADGQALMIFDGRDVPVVVQFKDTPGLRTEVEAAIEFRRGVDNHDPFQVQLDITPEEIDNVYATAPGQRHGAVVRGLVELIEKHLHSDGDERQGQLDSVCEYHYLARQGTPRWADLNEALSKLGAQLPDTGMAYAPSPRSR